MTEKTPLSPHILSLPAFFLKGDLPAFLWIRALLKCNYGPASVSANTLGIAPRSPLAHQLAHQLAIFLFARITPGNGESWECGTHLDYEFVSFSGIPTSQNLSKLRMTCTSDLKYDAVMHRLGCVSTCCFPGYARRREPALHRVASSRPAGS